MTVPKYGRGLEIYWLMKKHFPDWKYCGDKHFLEQIECANGSTWVRGKVELPTDVALYEKDIQADVVFVSDPQLRSAAAKEIEI